MDIQNHISKDREKILSVWESISREKFPSASDKSRANIRNHLPQLLDALCLVLKNGVLQPPKELSKIHGRQRFSFGDYSLDHVLGEYWLLKTVLFDHLEEKQILELSDFRLINRFFEAAATSAACEFTKLGENELKQSGRLLLISNQDLERFAAIAAHDLKSPISTIYSYAQLGAEDTEANPTEAKNRFETIQRISLRMIHLIDQLLEYTKFGESSLAKTNFPLSKSAEEALANLEKAIAEAKAQVTVENLPELIGDQVLFSQLFQNLIANSLKFRAEDRPSKINVGGFVKNNVIQIQVKDNGVGFDPNYQEEIFKPFKRGANSKGIKGSGLGLATVQKIVDLHGGTITAVGKLGEGAEFTIEIPVQ